MADETSIEDQNPDAGEQTPPDADGGQKPPWERDGEEFSPEKAWNLIQHLRADNLKLKTANESNASKLRETEGKPRKNEKPLRLTPVRQSGLFRRSGNGGDAGNRTPVR